MTSTQKKRVTLHAYEIEVNEFLYQYNRLKSIQMRMMELHQQMTFQILPLNVHREFVPAILFTLVAISLPAAYTNLFCSGFPYKSVHQLPVPVSKEKQ